MQMQLHTQPAFTCSNSTIETIEKGVNMFNVSNKNTSTASMRSFWCFNGLIAHRNSWTLDAKVGRWTLDAGLWTLDSGRWTLDAELWS